MISARGLVRQFLDVRAVDGLTFEVAPGEIYGLLGPNGAGKTTALRLLSALLRPTAGSAIVAGCSVSSEPREVRARVGLLTEVPGLYLRLTPREYLDFFARVHAVEARPARVEEMLRLVGLWDRRNGVMRTFSKGMQQRVAIARTLIQDPPVLLLDEPTAALDPEAARNIRDYVQELAHSRGRTVLLCTHNLHEAEELCQRLSIVQRGRQVAEGAPAALRGDGTATCVLRVRADVDDLAGRLSRLPFVDAVAADGPGRITYRTAATEEANPRVIRLAVEAGADVLGLSEQAASLEDVYLDLISQSGANADAASGGQRGALPPFEIPPFSKRRPEGRWKRLRAAAGPAWLIGRRELRETLRDANLWLPILLMPCLIGLLAGVSAFATSSQNTGAAGATITNAALDQLPPAAVQRLGNLPTTNREATLETLIKAFSIPLFWVIPVALTPAVAADSFVGERERFSLEPLLATPLGTGQVLAGKLLAAVVPAALGTWLGVLVYWGMTALSHSPYYPPVLIADPDWLFSLLIVAPLVALFTAAIAALISTRVSGYRVAYQLNGLIVLPVVLLVIPATAFLYLVSGAALLEVAAAFAIADAAIVAWAYSQFERERLLARR